MTGESVSLNFTTIFFNSSGLQVPHVVVLVVFGSHPVTKWPAGAIRDIFIKSPRGAFEILFVLFFFF